jgi:Peptidase family M23
MTEQTFDSTTGATSGAEAGRVGTGVFTSPISQEYNPIVTSSYGQRTHPVSGRAGTFHNGVDVGLEGGARRGVPHLAPDGGTVTYAGPAGNAGNVVVIDHGNGVVSRLFHLDKIDPKIKKGALVAKGQVIGEVGRTGTATAIHVHWEVLQGTVDAKNDGLATRLRETSVNPVSFLRNGDYSRLIPNQPAQTPLPSSSTTPTTVSSVPNQAQQRANAINNELEKQGVSAKDRPAMFEDIVKKLSLPENEKNEILRTQGAAVSRQPVVGGR